MKANFHSRQKVKRSDDTPVRNAFLGLAATHEPSGEAAEATAFVFEESGHLGNLPNGRERGSDSQDVQHHGSGLLSQQSFSLLRKNMEECYAKNAIGRGRAGEIFAARDGSIHKGGEPVLMRCTKFGEAKNPDAFERYGLATGCAKLR